MITTSQGTIGGKELIFHQCLDAKEAEEAGLPTGCSFYWTHGGNKILSPGSVIDIVIKAAETGQLNVQQISDPELIRGHYTRVKEAQLQTTRKHLEQMRAQVNQMPIPQEQKEQILKQYDQMANFAADPNTTLGRDGFAGDGHYANLQKLYDANPFIAQMGRGPA